MNDRDMRREALLAARVKGISGGPRILWTTKHHAQMRHHVWGLSEKALFEAAETKTLSATRAMGTSGPALMASVTFPAPGISALSDQCRSMIAAGILRGASVGFVPGKFKFSSDPQRPLGIDFLEGHTLTEWSCCAVPANPNCLVVGPVSDSNALSFQFKISDETPDLMNDVIKVNGWRLQNFAKNGPVLFCHDSGQLPVGQSYMPFVSGSKSASSTLTRSERLSEAKEFRRRAYAVR